MPDTPPKLLGHYQTPIFRIGDVVACARRGEVRITGLSAAPIPWPIGQTLPKGKGRALVLYGELADAVRRESAEAVMHYWGVKGTTVWTWRRALGVTEYNEGTTALKSELLTPVLDAAREKARPTWDSAERRGQDQRREEGQAAPASRHRGDAQGAPEEGEGRLSRWRGSLLGIGGRTATTAYLVAALGAAAAATGGGATRTVDPGTVAHGVALAITGAIFTAAIALLYQPLPDGRSPLGVFAAMTGNAQESQQRHRQDRHSSGPHS